MTTLSVGWVTDCSTRPYVENLPGAARWSLRRYWWGYPWSVPVLWCTPPSPAQSLAWPEPHCGTPVQHSQNCVCEHDKHTHIKTWKLGILCPRGWFYGGIMTLFVIIYAFWKKIYEQLVRAKIIISIIFKLLNTQLSTQMRLVFL